MPYNSPNTAYPYNATFLAPNELSQGITALANVAFNARPAAAYGTNASTASGSILAPALIAGVYFTVISFTGSFGAPGVETLDTVTNVVAALQSVYGANFNPVGYSWFLRILNVGASQTLTITTNTGWTLSGTQTIATATWRDFVATIASSTTATLQSVGIGTMP